MSFSPTTTFTVAMKGSNSAVEHGAVEAEVFGQWAVSKPHGMDAVRGGGYTVSHAPSGMAFPGAKHIPLLKARSLARTLDAACPHFEGQGGVAWQAALPIMKRIQQEWGL